MQTPSEPKLKDGNQRLEWAARSEGAKRSVFGNYRADESFGVPPLGGPVMTDSHRVIATNTQPPKGGTPNSLQSSIDLALGRAFIHRFLAKAYEDPSPEGWQWLCAPATQESLRAAAHIVVASRQSTATQTDTLATALHSLSAALCRDAAKEDSFHSAYLASFGHAARGQCPLNEIEYGDIKADPLFQPHRLADLAAFYSAFGLEVANDADERQDHICLELEFMCVLAAKEAYALENQLDAEELALCRDAQKKFLREHLGRWTPAFARRLASTTTDAALRALAEFTRAFIESECTRFAVNPGGEDLLLRPVDEAAESMCASCGIPGLPPGALPAT